MKSNLAEHFQRVRLAKGIRLGPLARLCGYRDISKGARRIDIFEKHSEIHQDLLVKLAAALGIDHETVARLIEEDRQRFVQEWTAWADTPIRPAIITSHVGAFCNGKTLPEGTTRKDAEECAAAIAKDMKRQIYLIFSRRLSMWFDEDGNRTTVTEATPGDTVVPYLQIGSRKFTFDLAAGKTESLALPENPVPEVLPVREEVVTDFGGVQLRSSFEITQDKPGQLTIHVEGPVFEPSDEELTLVDFHIGIETVLESHDVLLDDKRLRELRDGLDFDPIKTLLSGNDQNSQLLGLIENELLRLGVVSGEKKF